ncbi:hypothetical protein B0O80DRAFT_466460 [Mortierella sp. GBAus27b]|nr:hypothetical protein B0O80DRAFT_466460 [Mortierella sp. GBAus27b]
MTNKRTRMKERQTVFRLEPAPGSQSSPYSKGGKQLKPIGQLKKPVATPATEQDLGSKPTPPVTRSAQLRKPRASETTPVTKKTRSSRRTVTEFNKPIPRVSDEDDAPHEQPTIDNLAQARKDSANRVLKSILETSPMSTTLKRYKVCLDLWQKFCDDRYEGDCSVDAPRMLDFLNDVIFKRKVKKYISPGMGYSGVVGQKSSQSQGQSSQEQDEGWGSVDPPADTDALEWQLNQAMDTLKLPPPAQSDELPNPEEINEEDSDSDGEPGGFSKESENEVEQLVSSFITTVQDKAQGKYPE